MHCSLMEPLPMNTVLCMRLAIYLEADTPIILLLLQYSM